MGRSFADAFPRCGRMGQVSAVGAGNRNRLCTMAFLAPQFRLGTVLSYHQPALGHQQQLYLDVRLGRTPSGCGAEPALVPGLAGSPLVAAGGIAAHAASAGDFPGDNEDQFLHDLDASILMVAFLGRVADRASVTFGMTVSQLQGLH